MKLYSDARCTIVFGDAHSSFVPNKFKKQKNLTNLLDQSPFTALKSTVPHTLSIEHLIFLHQVHGAHGVQIIDPTHAQRIQAFSSEGDFLITDQPSIGLAVATADCLPIVLACPSLPALGVVHAGWRGTLKSIAQVAVRSMCSAFSIQPADIHAFFGPAAQACCYQFGPELPKLLANQIYQKASIRQNGNQFFFDVSLANEMQLQSMGVLPHAINRQYNTCTMCNPGFCSYRRDKSGQRQFSVALLR